MFRKFKILPLITLCVLLGGCIKEDNSHCYPGVDIRFEYVRHNYGGCRFGMEVEKVTVYIFDDKEIFVGSVSESASNLRQGNTLDIRNLQDNKKYTLLTWCGDIDDFIVGTDITRPGENGGGGLTVGESTLKDFRITMRSIQQGANGGIVNDTPGPLFYGIKRNVQADPDSRTEEVITLQKNSSTIKATVTASLSGGSKIAGDRYNIYIIGNNSIYDSSNDIPAGSVDIEYVAHYYDEREDKYLLEFDVLRIVEKHPLLFIIYDKTAGKVVLSKNIVNLILEHPDYNNQEEIDNEDLFELEFKLQDEGSAGVKVTIKVNGWEIVEVFPTPL